MHVRSRPASSCAEWSHSPRKCARPSHRSFFMGFLPQAAPSGALIDNPPASIPCRMRSSGKSSLLSTSARLPVPVSLQVWLPLPTLPSTTLPHHQTLQWPCPLLPAALAHSQLPTQLSLLTWEYCQFGTLLTATKLSFPHLTLGCYPPPRVITPSPAPPLPPLQPPSPLNSEPHSQASSLPCVPPRLYHILSLSVYPSGTVGPVWEGGSLGT